MVLTSLEFTLLGSQYLGFLFHHILVLSLKLFDTSAAVHGVHGTTQPAATHDGVERSIRKVTSSELRRSGRVPKPSTRLRDYIIS
ncbi:hypothetical protein PTKIN_Ptkin05aG0017800 [Pterospermum kingtungense]